ncbi:globin domain-containing protein [Nocardiopsis coralliicola]
MQPRTSFEVPLPDHDVIESVRQTCSRIPAGSTELADRFYEHLFAMAPELRTMFSEDMAPQRQRMSDALLKVLQNLDRPDQVVPYLRKLGAYHAGQLSLDAEHYPPVGRALLRAASDVAPEWSSADSSSWVLVYEWIAATMIAGAEERTAKRQPRSPDPAQPPPRAHAPSSSREAIR